MCMSISYIHIRMAMCMCEFICILAKINVTVIENISKFSLLYMKIWIKNKCKSSQFHFSQSNVTRIKLKCGFQSLDLT